VHRPEAYSHKCLDEVVFSEVRTFQDALYPSRHPCRFESSATQIRCRADAKLPELRFRAWLTEEASELELVRA
jgi:hypothetical protein